LTEAAGDDEAELLVTVIELLYFDGCPNHAALLPHLEQLLRTADVPGQIRLREISDADAAHHERFLGSPTVRVDGLDVEPGAQERDDFGLKCRLYRVPAGLRGAPLDEWVLNALEVTRPRSRPPAGSSP
jgi:hypothetical protein